MWTLIRLSVLSLVTLAFPIISQASGLTEICGSFSHVEGDVKFVVKEGEKQWVTVGIGQEICPGGAVATASTGRASIKFPAGEELHIAPKSRLVISAMESDAAQKKKKALMNLINGKVRANIPPGSYKSSSTQFRIKSETAVAGVRGTQFVMSYSSRNKTSEVITLRGEVQVGKPVGGGFNFSNPVTVRPGQKTVATPQAPPAPPMDLPDDEVKSVDDNTSAGNAPSTDQSEEPAPANAGPAEPASDSEGSPSGGEPVADKPQPDKAPEKREPASAPPPPSMVAPGDLAPPPDSFAGSPDMMLNRPIGNHLPPPVVCDFCDDRIADGPARLRIKVIRGNQNP